MDALIAFLAGILEKQTFFQVFVGGCTMMLIGWMVTRGRNDKDALPAPAPATLADVPPLPFSQGPGDLIDMIREQRDMDRRRTEDSSHIRECVRVIREETKEQTQILKKMAEDARVEARVAAERGPFLRDTSSLRKSLSQTVVEQVQSGHAVCIAIQLAIAIAIFINPPSVRH